jgi:hypothetical protein
MNYDGAMTSERHLLDISPSNCTAQMFWLKKVRAIHPYGSNEGSSGTEVIILIHPFQTKTEAEFIQIRLAMHASQ